MAIAFERWGTRDSERVDEADPDYRAFVDCIERGASLQDVYVDSRHGYAARDPARAAEPDADASRAERVARREFHWVYQHRRNLAAPLAAQFGLERRRVLDFGCGTGGLAVALALEGAEVVAVDPTAASLEALRHRARYFGLDDTRCRGLQVDPAPGLPFAARSFDRVVTNSVLEFIPEQRERYLAELVRVLRPGGYLVVSTENGWFPRDYYCGLWLPRLRRATARRRNLPYGSTWLEIRRWVLASGRSARDLSARSAFNSLDKLAARQRLAGRDALAGTIAGANRAWKALCRGLRLPSDLLFPYATYVFVVDD